MLTGMELKHNYPDNILIESKENTETGKHAVFCYLLRDGDIHKLMLSSPAVFETQEAAEKHLHDFAKACVENEDIL